jgi:hypothetical protein
MAHPGRVSGQDGFDRPCFGHGNEGDVVWTAVGLLGVVLNRLQNVLIACFQGGHKTIIAGGGKEGVIK